jgi:sugar lactone lactonase YvrE
MEELASGYALVEGPSADNQGRVWFSDVIGGGIFRWSDEHGVEQILEKRRGIGGLALHAEGGVVATGRDLIHVSEDGSSRHLLSLEGVPGFNDVGVDPQGRVLAGALRWNPMAGGDPTPGEVYVVDGPDSASVLIEGVVWANGIGIAPDGSTVYVSDYQTGEVLAHSDAETRVFARSPQGSADGLAVDETGGVWVALGQGGGVARFQPDGRPDRVLDVPADFVASVCFGAVDRNELYVATAGGLFRTKVDVAGLPVSLATV